MKRAIWPADGKTRRATTLAAIILLQALCALFFIGDVVTDLLEGAAFVDLHFGVETLAAIALLIGVAFMMLELRLLLSRMDQMDTGLMIARGRMAEVMQGFFDDWHLTEAERDVAIMVLKGLDNTPIAEVRQTAAGTVRAQTTSIYAKSGTSGRPQFVSLFVEELMSGDFEVPPSTSPRALTESAR
ncbi:helix-turn-helix transcriptional regulator [Jannaschia pohangensis]|uniref:Transcriptional regulator, LuxR family n=1 Tax=Jannaschia pohangensis TaxID=390807 RepID=A0A1I3I6B0_9RHOB|nr:LuxR C-terminal-related transcriptional regulator [Jannaschia pohangensis]SFI43452.1 transcriptional regulator, LuxR family [Jannaschia pohangensis]